MMHVAASRTPAGRTPDGLVLDVDGVGYLVAATPARGARRPRPAAEVVVETYLHVREDALQLYGFADAAERELFPHLLTVDGIGPKVALAIVSGSPAADLRRAIALEDTARFQAIPGIGKKTAERIVLELKEKLGAEDPVPISSAAGDRRVHLTARDALVELGYSVLEAEQALAPIDPELPAEERVRLALRQAAVSAVAAAGPRPGRGGARALAPPAPARRVRRPGGRQGAARDRARRREGARRGARPRPARRPARPRQDDARADHPRGARRRHPHGRRPALERKGDMAAILTALEPRDVLFVDEIHRINRAIEEILYPALEDFRLDIIVGQGPAARTLTLDLPPFTLVGATTRTGLLTTPLRDRFGMTFRLGYYDPSSSTAIVRRSAGILGVEIEDDAADEIARRSRGTPRIANRILRRVRDVAEVRHQGAITTADRARGARAAGGRRRGPRAHRPRAPARDRAQVRRRPGRPLDAGGHARRGDRHDRGRLRAVPAPARLPPAHPARPRDHEARPRARGAPRRRPSALCLRR